MYKNILTAADGSEVAQKATEHAIALAKTLGAELTAVVVTEPYEAIAFTSTMNVINRSDYHDRIKAHAENVLATVKTSSEAKGVTCHTVHKDNHYPYDGIIQAADDIGADLIVVGSHGRSGLERLLVGSEATKVLTHTKVPTLVVR